MNCSACNSQNIELLTRPEPVLDMPPGIYAAKTKCLECGLTLPMAFTQREVEDLLGKARPLYRMELTLSGLPQRINQASGAHWSTRYRESQRWHKRVLGRMLLQRLSPPLTPLKRAHLTLIRHSSHAPDFDGLVHSFKPVIDALKKCLILADDNMNVIGKPEYHWEKAKPKEGKIQIKVEELAS